MPVITLVLYCGDRPWDGAERLHEMLDFEGFPEKLKGYVEDYSIHIWMSAIRRTRNSGISSGDSVFADVY